MMTITLEVPDDLAMQLKIAPAAIPLLLQEALAAKFAKLKSASAPLAPGQPIYLAVIDFLSSSPTPQQVIDFKISAAAQGRLEDLLDKNRAEELTAEERAELDTYLHLSHLIVRLKARARSGQPLFKTTE